MVLESCVNEQLKVFRTLWKKYGVLFALGSFSFHLGKKSFTVIFTTYKFSSCCDGNCVIINSVHDKYNVLLGHTCRSTQSSLSMISFGSWRSWCSSITCVKKNENCQWRDQREGLKWGKLCWHIELQFTYQTMFCKNISPVISHGFLSFCYTSSLLLTIHT